MKGNSVGVVGKLVIMEFGENLSHGLSTGEDLDAFLRCSQRENCQISALCDRILLKIYVRTVDGNWLVIVKVLCVEDDERE